MGRLNARVQRPRLDGPQKLGWNPHIGSDEEGCRYGNKKKKKSNGPNDRSNKPLALPAEGDI